MQLVPQLCAWFARHRRDLPWRRTRDPYAIWISEAMLQQTRVEAVVPYYERFLARFPTVRALAEASVDDVVAAWSGLGYYRRARALHAAANEIAEQHGGELPRDRDAFLALPGVGPYTAGAVLSIAHGASEPVVDGNVARVFSRLFGYDDEPGGPLQRKLWSKARELVPARSSGDVSPGAWNQALMELGARVCTPRSPNCAACPLASECVARREGKTAELPRPAKRRAPIDVRVEVLVAERGPDVLLVRRPATGRMARMWELPTREVPDEDGRTYLWPSRHAVAFRAGEHELHAVSHAITHHRIRATVHAATAGKVRSRATGAALETRWAHRDELDELGLTGLSRKALRGAF